MSGNKWIATLIISLFCSSTAIAQLQQYLWHKDTIHLSANKEKYTTTILGAKDGLPSSEILALFQDSKGFVWIGTSFGVSRYDGNSFENYTSIGKKQLGKVNNIIEDAENNLIWITSDAGLFFYKNGSPHHIIFEDGDATTYNLHITKNNIYWLATARGPAAYNKQEMQQVIKSGKTNIAPHILKGWQNPAKQDSLIILIKTDDDGKAWLASNSTVYCYDGKSTVPIWHSPTPGDMINAIIPIEGKMFFVSTLHGVYAYTGKNKTIPVANKSTISGNIYYADSNLYYMCLEGIFTLDPDNYNLSFVCKIPDEKTTWLSCVMVDREKNIWIGLHDALLLQKKKLFYEYKNNNASIELYCGGVNKNGKLLFGAHRGKVYEKKDSLLVNYIGNNKSICSRSNMSAIYEDSRGWIWLGTAFQGIAVQQPGNLKFIKKADGLGCSQSYFFIEDSKGAVWTGGDGVLTRMETGKNNEIIFSSFSSSLNGDNWIIFLSAIEGPGNMLWSVGDKGVFKCDGKLLNHYSFADNIATSMSDIKKGNNGEVWIATRGDGIWQCYFDSKGQLQLKRKFRTEEGLHSNNYLHLLVDDTNNLWAVSYSGMSKISLQKERYYLRNYIVNDGFPDKNYQNARLLQDGSKKIWIITPGGIMDFDSIEMEKTDNKPLIVFNTAKAGESTYYHNTTPMQPLILSYNNNDISFKFSGIYFANPSAIRYVYRLSGNDSLWKDAGNNSNINFEGLRPGSYTLETKAVVGNKESNAIATYYFIVEKPFWQTWWFYSICAVVTGIVIYEWMKQKEKTIQKAAAEKAAIQKHIAELETKALKSQMNPHFVFNSLNSIAHLIASRQNERGIEYLTKFSKLLRIILDESENNFVALKDEIKMLDLYLQIEAMRFGDTFFYNIHTDDNIEEDDINVPTLLLHPIVENAVWHGLLHKEGERRLSIHYKKINENIVECTVKDNGIGLKAAKEMKEKRLNGIKQKSKGIQLIKDRLTMLELQFGTATCFSIEEIRSGNAMISGTTVTIQFPVLYES